MQLAFHSPGFDGISRKIRSNITFAFFISDVNGSFRGASAALDPPSCIVRPVGKGEGCCPATQPAPFSKKAGVRSAAADFAAAMAAGQKLEKNDAKHRLAIGTSH